MVIMTEGLRALAGDALRRTLIRFTHSPLSGAATGAISTAILQSSSATTVAAVGFVAANLLSFPAALGIIFGANLGTTITGWMVALLGFKLKLGSVALLLVALGAIVRLFGNGRLAAAGFAIAGFGLIFVGIDTLQTGMMDYREVVSFAGLPADTWRGRLMLLGVGALFTVIAQSSSAGVAATLTALFAGIVTFHQAAILVIGMDIGTTATALAASFGAGTNARRTAFSHVVYNLMTGAAAFFLVDIYVAAWELAAPGALNADPELALVAFHSSFNALGVMIALPFTRAFARLMERLVPGTGPNYIASLDPSLLAQPGLAIDAVCASTALEFAALLRHIDAILTKGTAVNAHARDEIVTALGETQAYLDRVHLDSSNTPDWQRLVASIHIIDHLQRLHERCALLERGEIVALNGAELAALNARTRRAIGDIGAGVVAQHWDEAHGYARAAFETAREAEQAQRANVMAGIASGTIDVPHGIYRLDAARWLYRVALHVERILDYLSVAAATPGASPAPQRDN